MVAWWLCSAPLFLLHERHSKSNGRSYLNCWVKTFKLQGGSHSVSTIILLLRHELLNGARRMLVVVRRLTARRRHGRALTVLVPGHIITIRLTGSQHGHQPSFWCHRLPQCFIDRAPSSPARRPAPWCTARQTVPFQCFCITRTDG